MDFAVLERLKEAAEEIHFPTIGEARHSAAGRAEAHKAEQRREFATLMRSIKALVHEPA